MRPRFGIALFCLLWPACEAERTEIRVMTSGGFRSTYDIVVADYQRATGAVVRTAYGPSMGGADDSIPMRLERGEPVDVVILAGSALDALIAQGRVVAGSRVDLVRSKIGIAVAEGAPVPDIGSVEALRRTLLSAESIAYSSSASGNYVLTELFGILGIADEVRPRSQRIEGEPVGEVVARGDAEIGFQQVSELLPIEGITYVGALPDEVQRVTVFAAGVATSAGNPMGARSLIDYLSSPAIVPIIFDNGLESAFPN